ncbi:hypothetical protein GFS24_26940 [Chitinophaga sp. SYP-B3965]|uniref:DUF6629 family protein n=1 Tax=Chitinophaga sp. SYP-B3965 TaxID=2663120 RepID=UPI001299FDB6|nr:DUF6629 family protein [Chitinophaga sp. SYP-B3965]MRG48775.1 hypothetical protein [Chitinophaga sp. SYP-B3965]
MCFSAEASFSAGTILLGIGVVSLYKAQSIPQKILACIPLLFSIQQFDEGILWLTFSNPAYMPWQQFSIHTFLLFAQVIWPVFVPLSILLIEKDPVRKKILRVTLGIGILFAIYLSYCLFTYDVTAVVSGHHIKYEFKYPYARGWYSGIVYGISTIISPLASSNKKMRLIGIIILIAFIISAIFYGEYLISVWCYFAAVISMIVLLAIIEMRKKL